MSRNIAFVASNTDVARGARDELVALYGGDVTPDRADIIVAWAGGTGSCCRPCTRRNRCLRRSMA